MRFIRVLILVVALIINLIISASGSNLIKAQPKIPEKIYTNKNNGVISILSDAEIIKLNIFDASKKTYEYESNIKNTNQRQITHKLSYELPNREGKFKTEYTFWDSVLNKSIYKQEIILDKTKPIIKNIEPNICGEELCLRYNNNELGYLNIFSNNPYAQKLKLIDRIDVKKTGQKTSVISKNWNSGEKYSFKVIFEDFAGNKSSPIYTELTTPEPARGGNVFGANENSPYGKNNRYSEQIPDITVIQKDSKYGETEITHKDVPQPELTYLQDINEKFKIYGMAFSPINDVLIEYKRFYPSYNSAKDYCNSIKKWWQFSITNCVLKETGFETEKQMNNYFRSGCGNSWGEIAKSLICSSNNRSRERLVFIDSKIIKVETVDLEVANIHRREQLKIIKNISDSKFNFEVDKNELSSKEQLRVKQLIKLKIPVHTSNYTDINTEFIEHEIRSEFSNPLENNVRTAKLENCNNESCKVLDVDYINQFVNEAGKYEYWLGWQRSAGGQSCGAASAVMINNFFDNLPKSNSLKSYVFQDNNQSLTNKKCNKGGAFAVTAYNSACNMSSLGGIKNYLDQYGLKHKTYWAKQSLKGADVLPEIKRAIDSGNPVILSYKRPIGHILVIKGYTYSNQLIVHDPYRDIQNNYRKGIYDYSGKDAIYKLFPDNRFSVNYLLEVKIND